MIDRSSAAQIPWQESYASPAAADIDNDGRIDLFFTTVYKGDTSRLFRNLGDWMMEDITAASGIRSTQTYQNAFADIDHDGRMDLITGGRLYRNVTEGGNWLVLRLQGRMPNTSAIGAEVMLLAGDGLRLIRQVEAGTGNGNQNDLHLHFGLGACVVGPVQASVRWPDGATTTHTLEMNRIVTLSQTTPTRHAP